MTKYDIKVKELTVLERISPGDLERSIKEVEMIVWLGGGNMKDVSIVLNKE